MRILTRRDTGLLTQWTFGTAGVDPDAQAFIIATGITDLTTISAIFTFVTGLKSNNLWNKNSAIYLLFTGSSGSTKYNLKNSLDTDAGFRIVWSGGLTFSSSGVTGNGVNGFGDTKLIPNTSLVQNDTHISFYSRTDLASNTACDMGVGTSNSLYCYSRSLSNTTFYGVNEAFGASSPSNVNSAAYFLLTRGTSTNRRLFRNSTKIQDVATNSTGLSSSSINLLRLGGFAGEYSTRQIALATIGSNLSDSEANTQYSLVQSLMTALGINV